jgi:hypothetical protein
MAEHYTRGTLEATRYCNTCCRPTQHKVSDGRLAHCLEHAPKTDGDGYSKKQAADRKRRERERMNPKLF